MDNAVIAYVLYLLIAVPLTIWVGSTLSRNGRVFLVDVFGGNDEPAKPRRKRSPHARAKSTAKAKSAAVAKKKVVAKTATAATPAPAAAAATTAVAATQ